MEPERSLDDADLEILRALQDNARIPFAELGRKVGLSGPAITDRVRKMEEEGIIAGYHAHVNSAKIGFPYTAFVRLRAAQEQYPQVITLARTMPEVRECHHTSGDDAFLLKLVATSEEALHRVLEGFRQLGNVSTSLILSTPVEKYST